MTSLRASNDARSSDIVAATWSKGDPLCLLHGIIGSLLPIQLLGA